SRPTNGRSETGRTNNTIEGARWRGSAPEVLKERGPGRVVLPGPVASLGAVGSAQRHFGDEQVVAARAVHVRVEDDHLAVGAGLAPRHVVIRDMRGVVMQQQPRVAAV